MKENREKINKIWRHRLEGHHIIKFKHNDKFYLYCDTCFPSNKIPTWMARCKNDNDKRRNNLKGITNGKDND